MSPTDRVLITSLEDRSRLPQWAALLSEGALVGIGSDSDVRTARRECAAFDNVMFVVGDRAHIPWQEGWFTVIVDPQPAAPTPEMLRVLSAEGQILDPRALNT